MPLPIVRNLACKDRFRLTNSCQGMFGIKLNMIQRPVLTKVRVAVYVRGIARGALDTEFGQAGIVFSQRIARPDDDVVGQFRQQHEHVLSMKATFVAMGESQPSFVRMILSFNPTAAQVVEMKGVEQRLSVAHASRIRRRTSNQAGSVLVRKS